MIQDREAPRDDGSHGLLPGRLSVVLPARKVARYLQIENKIRALVKYDLASGVPLVQ